MPTTVPTKVRRSSRVAGMASSVAGGNSDSTDELAALQAADTPRSQRQERRNTVLEENDRQLDGEAKQKTKASKGKLASAALRKPKVPVATNSSMDAPSQPETGPGGASRPISTPAGVRNDGASEHAHQNLGSATGTPLNSMSRVVTHR